MTDITLSSNLPQVQKFMNKIKQDLQHGFRMKGIHPSYTEIIRVWTQYSLFSSDSLHPHRFLIIATAKQNLSLPVSSLELHAYTKSDQSWKLHLIQHPFPQPTWKHTWQTLINTYPIGTPNLKTQTTIIDRYLQSQADCLATQNLYQKFLQKHASDRVEWIKREKTI